MDMKEFEKKVDEFIKSFTKEEMIKILKENGFEVIENEEQGKWEPKTGETIWFRNMLGQAGCLSWHEGIDSDSTPIFPTKEECEKYWKFRDVVKEKSYEFSKEEWGKDIKKYYIVYSTLSNDFYVDYTVSGNRFGVVHFKEEPDAQYIIDNYKEELLKYWL